ncbi:ABC-2 type transport system permease protein [Rhodococcus sp. PvR044]|uniref:ABC transporter permease n=1 Tax=unclassified Rhodococcus (in: high G+C Gram-positive bacteria) TaxID=192944 RepID=UPI001AE534B7|nr:ABC transporter permease [Rhodococcus sp. PvR099]MBP1160028.1 ABC-2 type transport system permease protein [Rhodococcus sp. PvR099]
MSTATVAGPRHPAAAVPRGTSNFTGTLGFVRLFLRRDRIVLPLWVLLLSLPLAPVYMGSIESIYPTEADRAAFAATIMGSPAQRAMYGEIYNDSLGAVGIWKAGMFYTLIAIAVILTVIRHTRAEEESGRTELLDSTVVGRYAGLTAALLVAFGASIATGLIGSVGLLTTDVPHAGSIAFGLALAASGIVFTAVAAVAAQLSTSARTARGIAFAVLGTAFALRAVGDAGPSALSWLSPLGWSLQVRPYAGDRWWVLLLHLTTAIALTAAAYALLRRRDVGAGLIAERLGSPTATRSLSGPFGLSWRLQRGTLIAWTIGISLYALLIGSVVHGIGDELGGSDAVLEIISRIGGTQALEDAFITISFTMLAVGAAALAISSALRLHGEETAQRAESVTCGAVGRTRWAASHIVFAVAGPAVALLAAGLVAGLTYGIAAGDIGGKLPRVLATGLVQLPAVWMLAAITVLLFGLVPRFTPVAWGVLVTFVALFLLGSISGVPQWVQGLQPFSHTPKLPGAEFEATPLVWLLVIDAALLVAGLIAFRRRDLRQ